MIGESNLQVEEEEEKRGLILTRCHSLASPACLDSLPPSPALLTQPPRSHLNPPTALPFSLPPSLNLPPPSVTSPPAPKRVTYPPCCPTRQPHPSLPLRRNPVREPTPCSPQLPSTDPPPPLAPTPSPWAPPHYARVTEQGHTRGVAPMEMSCRVERRPLPAERGGQCFATLSSTS